MRFRLSLLAALAATVSLPALARPTNGANAEAGSQILPPPSPPYEGQIARTASESSPPNFTQAPKAPKGAPNVLLILTDDVGFGATSTFGGPVPTITFDNLAAQGERYNAFHTTALCAPTRAALLTGRSPHKVGYGMIPELARGYPGYNAVIPKSAATIGEVLRQNGYSTGWFGKSHNTPPWEVNAAGPFDRWPNGLGFEYFYGFQRAGTDQWNPELFENTLPVKKPDDPKYFFERDLADHAINWLRSIDAAQPDKPFLMHYAPGTAHSPHHAPQDWIDKFKGQFDGGWDRLREITLARQIRLGIVPKGTRLTPRPDNIPAWDSLSDDERRLFAHEMEVFAGALAFADHQIGRVVDELKAEGKFDNTLIIYIQGDNGGGMEAGRDGLGFPPGMDIKTRLAEMHKLGGPAYNNMYPAGWGWATNSPFQWAKQVASHFGGTRNGLVISWPKQINRPGGLRPQFHDVVDIAPTIYEAAGVAIPTSVNGVEQLPLDGVSMLYSFNAPAVKSHRTSRIFEMNGHAAYYAGGWIASSTPRIVGTSGGPPAGAPAAALGSWELYNVDKDFSQSTNLAARYPDKLKELQDRFWREAAEGNILPLVDKADRMAGPPSILQERTVFHFKPTSERLFGGVFPGPVASGWRLAAQFVPPTDKEANGTIVMRNDFELAIENGVPRLSYKSANRVLRIKAGRLRTAQANRIEIAFGADAAGKPRMTLLVNGEAVGDVSPMSGFSEFSRFSAPSASIGWGFDVIDEEAPRPTAFNGKIDDVSVYLQK
jgi:arylsulfatase